METTEIDSFNFWMDQLATRSPSTRMSYQIYFSQFVEYVAKTPNQLIELQRKALASDGDPRENFFVETEVRQWLAELHEAKSASTCRTALSAVKSFFDLNLHPLRLSRRDRPQGDSQGSRIPEREEVIRIADASKWKYRAGCMFLKDSGLRISDVVRVKWSDLEDMGEGVWHFNIMTKKRNILACSFVGPETTRLLEQFKTKTGRVFRTGPDNFNDQINAVIKTAGIEGVTAHGLRKYFKSSLEHARVPEQHILFMMGKKSDVYSENRRSELLKEYKGAYQELSIYVVKEQMEEIENLKKQLEISKTTVETQSKRLAELERLAKKFQHPKIIEVLEKEVAELKSIVKVLDDPILIKKLRQLTKE